MFNFMKLGCMAVFDFNYVDFKNIKTFLRKLSNKQKHILKSELAQIYSSFKLV